MVGYFAGLGYDCPTHFNPADFLFMSVLHASECLALGPDALHPHMSASSLPWPQASMSVHAMQTYVDGASKRTCVHICNAALHCS